jgi:hypothetical protein
MITHKYNHTIHVYIYTYVCVRVFLCKEYQRMCIYVCIYIHPYPQWSIGEHPSTMVLQLHPTDAQVMVGLSPSCDRPGSRRTNFRAFGCRNRHHRYRYGSNSETEKMLTTFDRESCEIKKTSLCHFKNESTQEPTNINNPYLETQGENSPQGPLTYTQSNSCTAKWSNFVI